MNFNVLDIVHDTWDISTLGVIAKKSSVSVMVQYPDTSRVIAASSREDGLVRYDTSQAAQFLRKADADLVGTHDKIHRILEDMLDSNVPFELVCPIRLLSLEYEGIRDLVFMWREDRTQRTEIERDLFNHTRDIISSRDRGDV